MREYPDRPNITMLHRNLGALLLTASARGTAKAMQFWRSHCPREVNGLGKLPVLKQIVKRPPLGAVLRKDCGNPLCERPGSQLTQ